MLEILSTLLSKNLLFFHRTLLLKSMTLPSPVIVRHLGKVGYLPTYQAMQQLTENRTADTVDEIWVLEHFSVYTLGMAGKVEHLLNPGHRK